MKKTISVFLMIGVLLQTAAWAFPLLEAPETAAELMRVGENAALAESEVIPGVNALTGTDEALTLDNEDDLMYFSIAPKYAADAALVKDIGEQAGGIGNSLRLQNTGAVKDRTGHFVTKIVAHLQAKLDRPALLAARVNDYDNYWYVGGERIRQNDSKQRKTGYLFKKFDEKHILNANTLAIDLWSVDGNAEYVYFDNLAVIPYYRITYKIVLPDGTEKEDIVRYWLGDEAVDVSASDGTVRGLPDAYIPNETYRTEGFWTVGWTTEAGSDEIMPAIPLENADLVLYPVWEEYVDFSLDIDGDETVYLGSTAQFFPVFDTDITENNVRWSVDNEDIATIDENGVLTPAKQGNVKVICTSVYDQAVTAEKTISVRYREFEAKITGRDNIPKEFRSEKYSCEVISGDIPTEEFVWSVDDETLASIDSRTGVLMPLDNGVVKVIATSVYNPGYSVEYPVTLSSQSGSHTVTYLPGAGVDPEDVLGLPEPESGVGTHRLSGKRPEREGYVFFGWTDVEGGIDLIDSISLDRDRKVYAVWGKGFSFEFNGTTEPIRRADSCTIEASDEYLIVKTDSIGDARFTFDDFNINPKDYHYIEFRMAVDKRNEIDIFYKSQKTIKGELKTFGYNENGFKDAAKYAVQGVPHSKEGLDNWFVIRPDMFSGSRDVEASWFLGRADNIKNIWIDVTNAPNSTVYIDYIRFISEYPKALPVGWDAPAHKNDSPLKEFTEEELAVETIENPREVFGGEDKRAEAGDQLPDYTGITGDIIVNFDEPNEAKLFERVKGGKIVSVENSELLLSVTANGSATPMLQTIGLNLDAASHRYIIAKVKNIDLAADEVYLLFQTDGTYPEENKATPTVVQTDGERDMLVWDMSGFENWTGNIAKLRFAFGNEAQGRCKIDWLMFSDEFPADMDEIAGASEPFPVIRKEKPTFTDVDPEDWFFREVLSAYRRGLVEGKSRTIFDPQGTVTAAEAITLAVRVHHLYGGLEKPAVSHSDDWYADYIDAAIEAGIIEEGQFADYVAPVSRREVAKIMFRALPASAMEPINAFTAIPDVPIKDAAFSMIRRLYNAGIFVGSGDDGYCFHPDDSITRAEMAAVVNRMAVVDNRKRVITEAELASRRRYYRAADLLAASLGNCQADVFTVKNGFAAACGKTNDPIVYLSDIIGEIDGRDVTGITIAMKYDAEKIDAAPTIYFTAPGSQWTVSKKLTAKAAGTTENGAVIFAFDPTSNDKFADTVSGLRFDPFEAKDIEFAIEYVCIEY